MHQYKMGADWLERSFVEKEMRFLVGNKWDIIQQCALAVEKAKTLLSWVRQSVASRSREAILPLWSLGWVQCWESRYKREIELLEKVQWSATMTKGICPTGRS